MVPKVYETKPLDCFRKSQELMGKHWEEVMAARGGGKMLIGGFVMEQAILAGFGDYAYHPSPFYAPNVAVHPEFCVECLEAAEARGFARDVCGYAKSDLGSLFLGRYLFDPEFPKPDVYITFSECEIMNKWGQAFAEYLGIPHIPVDWPLAPRRDKAEHWVDYLATQYHDLIESVERITGKRCDDERLIEGVYNRFRVRKLFMEVALLNANIPATIDVRVFINLLAMPMWKQYHRETIELLQMAKDELKYRIDTGIAAVPVEQCRLLIDIMPPSVLGKKTLSAIQREYGAVWVVIWVYLCLAAGWESLGDGTIVPPKTLEEQGVVLNSREDAVRVLAEFVAIKEQIRHFWWPRKKIEDIISLVRQFHVDGVTLHYDRGCTSTSGIGTSEARLALQEAGIPVVSFEGNVIDPREVSAAEIRNSMERFLEVLGVKKLQD